MSDERIVLSYEEAVSMLPDGEMIHTFRSPGYNVLLGCDWDRQEILDLLRDGKPELSGEQATSMNHGLVIWKDGWLFIQTRIPETSPALPRGLCEDAGEE